MSLKSWKAKFYPGEAGEVDPEDAIKHSLTKWIGLRQENLKNHGLTHQEGWYSIQDMHQIEFRIDGSSCALCAVHRAPWPGDDEPWVAADLCLRCPLYQLRGVSCDEELESEQDEDGAQVQAPYFAFTHGCDPEPMIALLQQLYDKQQKEKSRDDSATA